MPPSPVQDRVSVVFWVPVVLLKPADVPKKALLLAVVLITPAPSPKNALKLPGWIYGLSTLISGADDGIVIDVVLATVVPPEPSAKLRAGPGQDLVARFEGGRSGRAAHLTGVAFGGGVSGEGAGARTGVPSGAKMSVP